MTRYVDLSGASAEVKEEFFGLAREADSAKRQAADMAARTARAQRTSILAAVVAAVVGGLLGFWRGRRAARQRIRIQPKVQR